MMDLGEGSVWVVRDGGSREVDLDSGSWLRRGWYTWLGSVATWQRLKLRRFRTVKDDGVSWWRTDLLTMAQRGCYTVLVTDSLVVSRKPGEPLTIEEIIVAPPMPREARIRIICTSLCHSDITFWKMQIIWVTCGKAVMSHLYILQKRVQLRWRHVGGMFRGVQSNMLQGPCTKGPAVECLH